ncbi:MAG TPA: hypothetical protein VFF78_07300 [Anaerolineaceae bacterium]|nr:hypothetical protein [Anaerolineaceae bacterium]
MQASLAELFDYAIQLEKASQALYLGLADLFAHQADVSHFWKQYANEERGHADYLARLRAGMDAARLAEPSYGHMLESARKCLSLAAQERLAGIHNLEDAYQLSSELENSETNSIFEFLIVNFSTAELEKSHKFLRTQLTTHINRLKEEFPAAYRSRLTRENLLAQEQRNG